MTGRVQKIFQPNLKIFKILRIRGAQVNALTFWGEFFKDFSGSKIVLEDIAITKKNFRIFR